MSGSKRSSEHDIRRVKRDISIFCKYDFADTWIKTAADNFKILCSFQSRQVG